jgi:hypothetical protein
VSPAAAGSVVSGQHRCPRQGQRGECCASQHAQQRPIALFFDLQLHDRVFGPGSASQAHVEGVGGEGFLWQRRALGGLQLEHGVSLP